MLPSLVAGDKTILGHVAQQYDVTSVGVNPTKDRAYRMRTYFLTMTVRVLCVVSLFWVRGPWVILVGIGAVVLPYVAVLIANAVSNVGGAAPAVPTPLELAPGDPDHGPARSEASQDLIVIDGPAERRSTNASGADHGASGGA